MASIQANDNGGDAPGSARGLLLHASYPASDISATLQARGDQRVRHPRRPGHARRTSRPRGRTCPTPRQFVPIEGAVHAFFGDYGPQPGDGEPTISHDEARTQIANASVEFVTAVAAAQARPDGSEGAMV